MRSDEKPRRSLSPHVILLRYWLEYWKDFKKLCILFRVLGVGPGNWIEFENINSESFKASGKCPCIFMLKNRKTVIGKDPNLHGPYPRSEPIHTRTSPAGHWGRRRPRRTLRGTMRRPTAASLGDPDPRPGSTFCLLQGVCIRYYTTRSDPCGGPRRCLPQRNPA